MTNDEVAELLIELAEEMRALETRFYTEAGAFSTHKVLEAFNLGMWRGLSQARRLLERRAEKFDPPPGPSDDGSE